MERRDFLVGVSALGGLAAAGGAGFTQAADTVAARAAMRELLQTVDEVQREYLSPAYGITRTTDIAEGQRFILHVLQTGLNFWLEADPERPAFSPYVTPSRKLLGDNPDALYYFAPIRGERRYRIRGQLAGATFTSFTIEAGSAGGGAASGSISALDDGDFEVGPDGSFEITLSAERPAGGGNWLQLDPSAGQITTRHYFESRNCVAADPTARIPLSIEPLDPPPLPSADDDAGIARRIGHVANFLRAMTVQQPRPDEMPDIPWVSRTPNQFSAPGQWRSETGYGNLHAHYAMAPYALGPDEALLIEGNFPRCRFANVVLWNRFMQSYDFMRRRISVNRNQIRFQEDGSFRLIVAHQDPGQPNWLDTEGRPSGLIYWRFLLARDDIPTPHTRVVKLARL